VDPHEPRDPTFGRFAFTVITIALVIIVLGLTGIYYYFQSGAATSGANPISALLHKGAEGLGPNQVMLYYTKDGKQLVSTVATAGNLGMSPADKARRIV
jgi:hypothetical protein